MLQMPTAFSHSTLRLKTCQTLSGKHRRLLEKCYIKVIFVNMDGYNGSQIKDTKQRRCFISLLIDDRRPWSTLYSASCDIALYVWVWWPGTHGAGNPDFPGLATHRAVNRQLAVTMSQNCHTFTCHKSHDKLPCHKTVTRHIGHDLGSADQTSLQLVGVVGEGLQSICFTSELLFSGRYLCHYRCIQYR